MKHATNRPNKNLLKNTVRHGSYLTLAIKKLKELRAIKSGVSRQLKSFCELLEKTVVITKDISRYTNLDTLDTLTALIGKLPYNLRGRWVKRSVEIEKTRGLVAEFSDLVEFVKQESDVGNSFFGLRTLNDTSNRKSKPFSSKATVAFLEEENKKAGLGFCSYCKDTRHKLLNCARFLDLSLNERYKFVKSTKLCHKCLSFKHRTPACKRTNTCRVDGCSGAFHHTLLVGSMADLSISKNFIPAKNPHRPPIRLKILTFLVL